MPNQYELRRQRKESWVPGEAIAVVQRRHRLGPLVIEADRVQCQTRAALSLGLAPAPGQSSQGEFFHGI